MDHAPRSQGDERLLADVVRSFDGSPDPRLREIVQAAVRHLHEFVSEVGLSREEWRQGIDFLTAVGHMSSESRQEFILLSDVLGVSSLVEAAALDAGEEATENTVLGPFYVPDSPLREYGDSILENEDPGPRLRVRGRVTDTAGAPLAGAMLDVWQNASNRLYAVQDPNQHPSNLRGRFLTGDDGGFAFTAVRPVPYQIPGDGPVGRLLDQTGRHPWRAAHIHVIVSARGHETLTTHLFDAESPYLDSDAVFGVRDSLVVQFTRDADSGDLLAEFDFKLEAHPPSASPS
jgi:protocatechuate 3,4-dioxygenase beta subunit